MKNILYGLLGLVLVAGTATLASAGITYSNPVDNPSGVAFTQLYGVNNTGLIVGAYQTGGGLTSDNSFTYNGSTFTSINCPTSTCTNSEASESTGINNAGTTFGTYVVSTNNSFGGYEDVTGTNTFSTEMVTHLPIRWDGSQQGHSGPGNQQQRGHRRDVFGHCGNGGILFLQWIDVCACHRRRRNLRCGGGDQ